MDKTHNISLGGFAFNIEDAAYRNLNKYLKDIRISLGGISGIDDIIHDVEYRMAELLREKMLGREVVNSSDVAYLVEVLGQPEEFYNDEFLDEEPTQQQKKTYTSSTASGNKKLFRDPDDKMIGGVCSGVAHYIGVDAVWVRLLVVLLPFMDFIFLGISTGMLIFTYMVLWLVIPLAKSTADKLQMRGEPVNIDSIKDFFGNSPDKIRDNVKDFSDDARRVAQNSGSVIGKVLSLLLKVIAAFFITILLLVALGLLVVFLFSLLGLGIAGFSLNNYLPFLFENNWEQIVGYISLAFVMIIPAVVLILIALRLISSRYRVPKFVAISLPMLWLLGMVGLAVVTGFTWSHFRNVSSDVKTVNMPTDAQTIIVQRDTEIKDFDIEDVFSIKNGYFAVPVDEDVVVKKSTTGFPYVELQMSARGQNNQAASRNLEGIKYNYSVQDSLIRLDNFVFLPQGSKWRKQKVKTILYLPENKQAIFRNVDDIEYYENGNLSHYDADSENIYTFENGLLKCINCKKSKKKDDLDIEDYIEDGNFEGEIRIKKGNDSIIIKKDKNGTSNLSISSENDSISN